MTPPHILIQKNICPYCSSPLQPHDDYFCSCGIHVTALDTRTHPPYNIQAVRREFENYYVLWNRDGESWITPSDIHDPNFDQFIKMFDPPPFDIPIDITLEQILIRLTFT